MKRFRFNLEKILELRGYEERRWELKLGEATGRCLSIKRKIADNLEEKKRVRAANRISAGVGIEQFRRADGFSVRIEEENRRLSSELQECEQEKEEIKAKFLEASRKRKVIERLKERKQQLYYHEQRKEEQKEIDDLAAGRYRNVSEHAG